MTNDTTNETTGPAGVLPQSDSLSTLSRSEMLKQVVWETLEAQRQRRENGG